MKVYGDGIEMIFRIHLDGELLGCADDILSPFEMEHDLRNGTFWALKWATKFCPGTGKDGAVSSKEIQEAIQAGKVYDVLVDALKADQTGLMELSADKRSKRIVCFEGKSLTGFDHAIVEHQHTVGPTRHHASLTADKDKITSEWSAGDYRRTVRKLAEFAECQKNLIVAPNGKTGTPQPTLVWLNRPTEEPDCHVFDSLTMPQETSDTFMWQSRELLETPIVNCAGHFCALSSDLKAIACLDDYMLRLAAREDQERYNKVSGLREGHMTEICLKPLIKHGWKAESSVKFQDPDQEADIIAKRSRDAMVIELKSTLRPQAIREVNNRNEDILKGLSHVERLVQRGAGDRGLSTARTCIGDVIPAFSRRWRHGPGSPS